MYVAMTRARSKVLLVADPHSPSEFVEELRAHPEVHTKDHTVIRRFRCPSCDRGAMELTNPKRLKGYAWKCSLRPYCAHRAKYCPDCMVAPATSEEGELRCLAGCSEVAG